MPRRKPEHRFWEEETGITVQIPGRPKAVTFYPDHEILSLSKISPKPLEAGVIKFFYTVTLMREEFQTPAGQDVLRKIVGSLSRWIK